MAYANYRYKGQNFIGEVHGEHLIPLAGLTDVGPETSAGLLANATRLTESPVALSEVTLRAASPRAGKILCVGLNYKDHADDASTATFPVLFPKYTSTLIGPADNIILPPESTEVDFEGELAVIIGKTGRRIPEQDAIDHILGYCVSNDITMRDYQNKSHQWLQGKIWDNTTPDRPLHRHPGGNRHQQSRHQHNPERGSRTKIRPLPPDLQHPHTHCHHLRIHHTGARGPHPYRHTTRSRIPPRPPTLPQRRGHHHRDCRRSRQHYQHRQGRVHLTRACTQAIPASRTAA